MGRSTAPISQRVSEVIDNMTLADEITLVEGDGTAPPNPYVFYMPGIPSVCIPYLGEEDGPAGVADQMTGVTQLPAGVGLAATFDPSLANKYGQVIGQEELGKGAQVNLGPTVNIDRDPRWGRSFEAFTEDPFLNGALTVSEIDGVQSTGEMSQVKHYAAYNQETNRNTAQDNVVVSDRVLHEIYMPAFEAAVKQANVASVMCSYAWVNGTDACNNSFLLNSVLKQEWGFGGFVTSDYGALHGTDRRRGGHRPGAAVQHQLRDPARDRGHQRHDSQVRAQHDGAADPDPDVPLRRDRQSADRHHHRHGDDTRPCGGRHQRRRQGRHAAEEHRPHAAAVGQSRRNGGGDRAVRLGVADLWRRRQRVRAPVLARHATAGPGGGGRQRYASSVRSRACQPTARCRRSHPPR